MIDPQVPLTQLASIVNDEHRLTIENSRFALQHATRCGTALLQARDQVGLADWAQWVQDNVSVSPSTVQRYIRLAKYETEVRTSEAVSVSEALEAIKGLPPTGDANDIRRAPEETVARAKKLRAQGASVKEIASTLGVHRETVSKWTDPEVRANSLARQERQREVHRNTALSNRAATFMERSQAILPTDSVGLHRREGMADAAVLLVAKRIMPTMNLTGWGEALGLNYQELTAAVARFQARAKI